MRLKTDNDIFKIASTVFEVSEETLSLSDTVDDIESWDSLKHLNLILAIEDEFNISFTEEESVEIESLELMKELIKEKGIDFK